MTSRLRPTTRLAINRRILDSRAGVSYLTYRTSMRPLLPDDSTDVVVDGFPRTANSYAFYAFKVSNPHLTVRGHTHSSDTLRKALELGITTLLLIREPRGCIASFTQFVPGLTPEAGLRHYRHFFRAVERLGDGLQVATFPEVTSDLADVMRRLRTPASMNVVPYAATSENEAAVRQQLDHSNEKYAGGSESTAARPSTSRRSPDDVMAGLDAKGRKLLIDCENLYAAAAARCR